MCVGVACLWAACAGTPGRPRAPERMLEASEEAPERPPEASGESENVREAVDAGPAAENVLDAWGGVENIDENLVVRLAASDQDALDGRIREAIDSHLIPGAVVVLGRADGLIFQRAYGLRETYPGPEPMTLDTIFDLASLTKPVVTAMAVMQLAQAGRLDLDAPVSRYLPEFAAHEKTATVRQLLLHVSGLPSVDPLSAYTGPRAADLARILALAPEAPAGTRYAYSDLGYIVLGALVEHVSGDSLADYARGHILGPLHMSSSAMGGVPGQDARVAPTEERDDLPIRNVVDDPRAYRLGGYAGNAGLFSSADDLARFCRMMLGQGELAGARLLSAASVAEMTEARDLPGHQRRGLGWDMDPDHASGLSAQAFGHGGYTGTWLYVDPAQDLFVVLLTNVVHGGQSGTLGALRRDVARVAVDALPRVAAPRQQPSPPVLCGVDLLEREGLHLLAPATPESTPASHEPPASTRLRVGLLTHGAARTRDGLRTVDLFVDSPAITLTRIFTPEHGMNVRHEGRVRDSSYRGVPITSLFGQRRAPTLDELSALDVLVVDLVDVGTRFYTYPSTLLATLQVAAQSHTRVVILDRPNPLGGESVEGPVSSPARRSFVNSFPLPVRHGMTLGELGRLFVSQLGLDVRLSVLGPTGWLRSMLWEQTGLAWTAPSPNLPTARAALLYAATGLVEGANVSVGRGTDTPFAVVGAPYLDGAALTARLEARQLPGVRFEAVRFRPRAAPHRGRPCRGVRLIVTDESAFLPVRTGFALLLALYAEAPRDFDLDATGGLVGDDTLLTKVREHTSLEDLVASWQANLAVFMSTRAQGMEEPSQRVDVPPSAPQ